LFVSTRRVNGGLSTPSITISSWLSASWPPPPNIPGIAPWLTIEASFCTTGGYGERRSGARSLKSRSRHARVSRIMSPVGLSAPFGP
jgi:hypothetical protein